MKKLIHIALLFISFTAFAQNKFIEVEVKDTVALTPLSFRVNFYIEETINPQIYELEDEVAVELASTEASKNKEQELKQLLESKKYIVKPVDQSELGIMDMKYYGEKGFTVTVNGAGEVEKLKQLVKDMSNVTTTVKVVKYADEQKAETLLINKLIEKAKTRAAIIGASSGLKVGRILEVREGQQQDNSISGLEDFYKQIAMMGRMGRDNGDYSGSLSKTFMVKFAAE